MKQDIKEELKLEFVEILFREQTHLAIYDAQSKRVSDQRVAAFFERFKHLEEEHVAKMELLVEQLGARQKPRNKMAPLAGYLGTAMLVGDLREVLRINLFFENKAVHGYTKPITKAEQLGMGIADYLRENQLEAELMGLWIQEELTRFSGGRDDKVIKADFFGAGSDDY